MKYIAWNRGKFTIMLGTHIFGGCMITMLLYREKEIRTEYVNVSELRSIIPSYVYLMALTATVSPSKRKKIMKTLGLREDETVTIERLPNKRNIMYKVRKKPKEKEFVFTTLTDQVKNQYRFPQNHNLLLYIQGTI